MKSKKLLIAWLLIFTLLLQACSNETSPTVLKENSNEVNIASREPQHDLGDTEKTVNKEELNRKAEYIEEEVEKADVNEEQNLIDTSAFVYSTKVEVSDLRDITEHIDLAVYMNNSVKPGLATQHVFTQTYDFLQQKDIEGAKTVTIGVMSGEFRVAQITVERSTFKAGEHLIDSVLNASKIDKMNPDVKEYGEVMELW